MCGEVRGCPPQWGPRRAGEGLGPHAGAVAVGCLDIQRWDGDKGSSLVALAEGRDVGSGGVKEAAPCAERPRGRSGAEHVPAGLGGTRLGRPRHGAGSARECCRRGKLYGCS